MFILHVLFFKEDILQAHVDIQYIHVDIKLTLSNDIQFNYVKEMLFLS